MLIVLDCVRSQDFYGGEDAVPGLKASESLARESVVYPRAVAPASWTAPSHASIFTGLYPWESGAFGTNLTPPYVRERTLAENLGAAGYQTGAFSANPFISPHTGLDRGFDTSRWGSWSDCYLRKVTKWVSTPHTSHPGAELRGSIDGPLRLSRGVIRDATLAYPVGLDVGTRLLSRALGLGAHSPSRVAPWIETSINGWLSEAKRDRPVFCFVNLMDAHEPFVGLPERITDVASWLGPLVLPHKAGNRNGKRMMVSRQDGEKLRGLYRVAIGILDSRLKEIFRVFQGIRDWDNTCVVVTSDHGQAFAEAGALFHAGGASDAVHRVPLIVKPPLSNGKHRLDRAWTPLTTLPSIVARAMFGSELTTQLISNMGETSENDHAGSYALSLAENTLHGSSKSDSDGGSEPYPELAVVGYSDAYDVVIDTRTLDCRSLSNGMPDGFGLEPRASGNGLEPDLRSIAMQAAMKMRESRTSRDHEGISRHLAQWGYE
ncbi:MAG: sulfatase-like hydrolase/transferase [Thermoplasmata archaeon]